VGYAGGAAPDPAYHAIGDHSETVQIDFDPTVISYEALLDEFLAAHNPTQQAFSRQYASLIHYHDEEQRLAAERALADYHQRTGRPVYTQLVPLGVFTLAEDYHQKYQLRQVPELETLFERIYPDYRDLANSTAATRVNAYAGGHLSINGLAAESEALGLVPEAQEALARAVARWYP